jgi:serine phosphatase RsbU (regulator of sigma subunit)
VSSAPVGIAVFDMDLRYVRVNEAFAALSGLPVEDHVGGRIGDVVPLPAQVGADLRRVVTTGRTILGRHVEVGDFGAPDAVRHLSVSYYPVRTTSGVLVGAGATVVEITDTKRAEVERAALLQRAEAAQQRLSVLATASSVVTTTMELDELLHRLARVLTPAVADWCIIQLVGTDGEAENVTVSHRDASKAAELAGFLRTHPIAIDGPGPIADVLRSGVARMLRVDTIGNAVQQAATDRGEPELALGYLLQSSVVVPIESHGTVRGVLVLSTEGDRVLDDDDLDLAVEIAHRAALAIENARAFQQEHQIAENLQRAMLPETVPIVPGIDIAVRYLAATDGASVGGDWYDVIAFEDEEIGVVVGDVVGHDLAASATMGQLRSALLAYACESHEVPGEALTRLDRVFDTLGLTYATCVFGVLDRARGSFRWSNAGHPPPLLVRDGRSSFLAEGSGVLLGVTGGAGASHASTTLQPGDHLVLYTDGLVERRGEDLGDGLDRLARVASRLRATDADSLCDGLLAEMLPASASRADDVAILVGRVVASVDAPIAHRIELEPTPASAMVGRGFTAGVREHAGWGEHVDTATLLVSELVTNAVRHGAPPCILAIRFGDDGDTVEISVTDGDPRLPVVRPQDELAEDGRGFLLVDVLSADWGVRPVDGVGKATWFSLHREGPGS